VLSSYRLGIFIVSCVVLISGAFATLVSRMKPAPAGQNLGDAAYPLGSFRFTDRSGRPVTEADLANDFWVASFIFTRCPTSCPRIASVVSGLQHGPLRNVPVKFVSISVDPDFDTPEILSTFARSHGADPDRWLFLTGPKAETYDLILKRFHLAVRENPDAKPGVEQVIHSDKLALVGPGNRVLGVYSSGDIDAVRNLISTIKQQSGLSHAWVRGLPAINATLNGSCAVLLALALVMIRTGRWKAHAVLMSSAVLVSTVFLGCYLLYHYYVGSVAYRGEGWRRLVYFTILISHTTLATLGVVPLVIMTLTRAFRREFAQHALVARITFPIWMYVSVTGVIIYLMLYQLPIPTSLVA
jgi:protein SCO1/2